MLDQIRQEQIAMEAAIPLWDWDDEYDEFRARLAKEKLRIMNGGEEK